MNWSKKWNRVKGGFEYLSDDGLIAIFKDEDGFKYRFIPSVMTLESSGYATSIHFWKTLSGIKSYLEKNTHYMEVKNGREKDFCEYKIFYGEIKIQENDQ
jgi:hypothetical protein